MLQRIRDKVQGWVAGLIIVILVVSFLFWGIQYYIEQSIGGGDPVVAKINGQKIYSKDLNQAYQVFLQRQQIPQTLSDTMRQQIKQYVLQGLVTNALLVQSAEKAGFHADLNQIEKMIAADPTFQVNGRFSPEKLQQILYTYGLSPNDFFNKVLTAYITQQVTGGIQDSAFVTPNQLKEAYLLFKQLRNFKYTIVPASQFAANIKISDAEIQDYYNQHQDQFIQSEKVQVSYIILSPADLKKQIQVSSAEMKDYYQNHKDNFTVHEKSKAPVVKSFDEVSASLKQMLIAQKVEKLFSQKSDQLANLVYTNPTTLDVAAKQLGLQIQTSPLIEKKGSSTGVFSEPKVIAAIFKSDVLQAGNNSEPVELKDGGLVVVRLLKHVPSQPFSLTLVRDKIQKLLASQAAGRQAGVMAYKIQSNLLAGEADKKLSTQYASLHWIDKEKVARGDRSIPNEILTAAFNLKLSKNTSAAVTTAQLSNGDYAVIVLKDELSPDFSKASKQELNILQAHLASLEGQLDYKFYIKSALDKISLKIYPKNF